MEQMKQWHIKEFSQLTNVSVRTLHHYDHVDLLKPSVRSANGYRWYSTSDLVTLQQIIALKFFGFGLSQIKTMLQQQPSMLQHLLTQQQMLKDQVAHLQQAQAAMATLVTQLSSTGSFDWQDLTTLIERYRMTQELKNTWAGKALNEAQLAQYVTLRQKYPQEIGAWENLLEEINRMEMGAPDGPDGERAVKALSNLMVKMKPAMGELRTFNAEVVNSIRNGTNMESPLSDEGNMWLAKASLAYWLKRWDGLYEEISKNLQADPKGAAGKKVATAWRKLLEEQCIGQSKDLVSGLMLWQETTRQNEEIGKQTTMPDPNEQLRNKAYCKIIFDAAAMNWVAQALEAD